MVGEKFKCILLDWESIYEYSRVLAGRIRKAGFKPEMVVAIARGGFVPARSLCDLLGVVDLVSIKVDHWGVTASKDKQARLRYPFLIDVKEKKLLLVDDLADTGESFKVALKCLKQLNPSEVRTAGLFVLENSSFTPDYYAAKKEWAWFIFPWNYVEDMCYLVNKLFKEKKEEKSLWEVHEQLRENHSLNLREEKLREVMKELVERRALTQTTRNTWARK